MFCGRALNSSKLVLFRLYNRSRSADAPRRCPDYHAPGTCCGGTTTNVWAELRFSKIYKLGKVRFFIFVAVDSRHIDREGFRVIDKCCIIPLLCVIS